MSDSSSRGIRQYLRTRTRHEDDIVPVIIWFLAAHAAGIVAAWASDYFLQWYGIIGETTVEIVGGGHVSHVTWTTSEYYSMYVQMTMFFMVFAAFLIRDWRHTRD